MYLLQLHTQLKLFLFEQENTFRITDIRWLNFDSNKRRGDIDTYM